MLPVPLELYPMEAKSPTIVISGNLSSSRIIHDANFPLPLIVYIQIIQFLFRCSVLGFIDRGVRPN